VAVIGSSLAGTYDIENAQGSDRDETAMKPRPDHGFASDEKARPPK
jgi:hypothetical protein